MTKKTVKKKKKKKPKKNYVQKKLDFGCLLVGCYLLIGCGVIGGGY